jgi:hypothetical protein
VISYIFSFEAIIQIRLMVVAAVIYGVIETAPIVDTPDLWIVGEHFAKVRMASVVRQRAKEEDVIFVN